MLRRSFERDPWGGGDDAPSADVLSIGIGGEVVVECPGIGRVDGPDFAVFENAFFLEDGSLYAKPAQVSVFSEGDWYDFPCDPFIPPFTGCAGVTPVYANVDENRFLTDIDPTKAGGDWFDLADLDLPGSVRLIRIRDLDGRVGEAGTSGFDLDAIFVRDVGFSF